MTAWVDVLTRRRLALANMIQARAHAAYAGDRSVVHNLDGLIYRQRGRVHYAEKMAAYYPRVWTRENELIATPVNRPDNARPARKD